MAKATLLTLPREAWHPIRCREDAEAFLTALFRAGLDFHPDDEPGEVQDLQTGEHLFTDAAVKKIWQRMDEVRTFHPDPAEVYVDLYANE